MKRISDFFTRTDTPSLPSKWLDDPLPPAPKKRAVGRPRKESGKETCKNKSAKEPSDESSQLAKIQSEDSIPLLQSMNPSNIQASKRGKYKAYTVKEKVTIVQEAKTAGLRPIAAKYNLTPSTLAGWMKTDFSKQRNPGGRLSGGGRKISYGQDVDSKIISWVLEQREQQIPVSGEMIMAYAKTSVQPQFPNFQASRGWLDKFMKRHHLSLRSRTSMAQKLPSDLEDKVTSFHQFVKDQRRENEYDYIINMDETPAYFDVVPSKTVDITGKKTIKIRTTGSDKRHLTVILAVSSCGSLLPAIVIFKGKRELRDIRTPTNVLVRVQEKGWVDENMMIDWIRQVLRPFTHRIDR